MDIEIVVVGSLNLDTTIRVEHLPAPGETVVGTGRWTDTGGKGANQAVAAARLGRDVAMVGAVGDDDAGRALRNAVASDGVDVSHLGTSGVPTGTALIAVDDGGENMIVVDPGANGTLMPSDLPGDLLGAAVVTLLQHEIPAETVKAAVKMAGGTVVLNPAPGRPLAREVLERVSVLVPNAIELAVLTGREIADDPDQVVKTARSLQGPQSIVVTLGAYGALVVQGEDVTHVPAPEVDAVDPTAAGDAFCGGLADALVDGIELVEAVRWAVRCGAVTVTRPGAQSSLPTRSEVEVALGGR